jgi:hypothetical protein
MTASQPELIGLANSNESVEEVKLKGDLNTAEFWDQDHVLESLRTLLNDTLQTSPLPSPIQLLPTTRSSTSKTSLFGKKNDPKAVDVHTNVAMRISLKVHRDEACYRTQNDFGLYDTISRPVVVINIFSI